MTRVLDAVQWQPRQADHERRIDELTREHRQRRRNHERHPVQDFLFDYYHHSVGKLRRWHPGAGVVLTGADHLPRSAWPFYRIDEHGGVSVDLEAFRSQRRQLLTLVRSIVARTAARPAQLSCFGLHEWAMVYRWPDDNLRHSWPLRLGADGTDAVVEDNTIRCSHVDAFRFFTDAAAPRNTLTPTRQRQSEFEQPGCLHAGMDVYKWAFKLSPAVSSELVADCFELAQQIRELDMRASPYDFRDLGYEPVAIETPAGKAQYVAAQREFARLSNGVRSRLLAELDAAGL